MWTLYFSQSEKNADSTYYVPGTLLGTSHALILLILSTTYEGVILLSPFYICGG